MAIGSSMATLTRHPSKQKIALSERQPGCRLRHDALAVNRDCVALWIDLDRRQRIVQQHVLLADPARPLDWEQWTVQPRGETATRERCGRHERPRGPRGA